MSRFNVSSQNKSEISVLCLPCPKNEIPTTAPQFPTNGTKLIGWGANLYIVTLILFYVLFLQIQFILLMYKIKIGSNEKTSPKTISGMLVDKILNLNFE